MQDFRNLLVWQKAHDLVLRVYKATSSFPNSELFGLTSQMRRSASSIPTNLAEGCGRGGNPELIRFATISMGSSSELEYQLLLARDIGLLDPTVHSSLDAATVEVKKMLGAFITGLRRRPTRQV
jgi:four helix bundle protein